MQALLICIQLALGLAILNVWLVRRQTPSPWRGGLARSLREEFAAYGLPSWVMTAVGAAKVTCALLLLLGIFFEGLVRPAALGVALFMAGAVAMHIRIADPLRKSLPAAALLVLALTAALLPAQ